MIDYEWLNNNSEIIFKKNSPNGFDIILSYDKNFIYLNTNTGFHYYPNIINDFEQTLIEVMGLVRDLLSNNMRLKEFLSNNTPYKWSLQCYDDGEWKDEAYTKLIFWNYLGKKSERIYSNNILPARELK
jgi:hypothetical protein